MPDGSQNGWLQFAGHDLRRLAAVAAGTPFYAYSRVQIDETVARLRRAFPAEVRFWYSHKANPWPPIVFTLAGLVDGFDVSSESELRIALATGMSAASIQLTGPGKSSSALRTAIAAGATISLESNGELERVDEVAREIGLTANLTLRVNADFGLRRMGMNMGGSARQFGVDCAACPVILQAVRKKLVRFRGLHIFWGSQCLDARTIMMAHENCLATARHLQPYFPNDPEIMNFGGGFGIPYTAEDSPLDVELLGASLHSWLPELQRLFPTAHLVFELGRYLVGPAGIYVCRVIDKKTSHGETFLVTDGGMHHQLAASGNLGQVVRRNYPLVIGNRVGSEASQRANITGCLCPPIDLLGSKVPVPVTEVGDYVVIFQSGAYGLSASPVDFLGHPPPAELLL